MGEGSSQDLPEEIAEHATRVVALGFMLFNGYGMTCDAYRYDSTSAEWGGAARAGLIRC